MVGRKLTEAEVLLVIEENRRQEVGGQRDKEAAERLRLEEEKAAFLERPQAEILWEFHQRLKQLERDVQRIMFFGGGELGG